MGRSKKSQLAVIDSVSQKSPILPVLDLRPDGVYRPEQVRQALGLRASSLRTEWRRGRLRIVRRCGRNYLIGRDVLAWLDGGEVRPSTRCDMVKCRDCGYLALRGKNGELIEAAIEYREQGVHGVAAEWRPFCFVMVPELREETRTGMSSAQKALEVICRDRDCQQSTDWEQGYSPKEHRDMQHEKTLMEMQAQQRERDREWQDSQRRSDRLWNLVSKGGARHAGEYRPRVQRGQTPENVLREGGGLRAIYQRTLSSSTGASSSPWKRTFSACLRRPSGTVPAVPSPP